uniref:Uncharacterized protein n=1 Tax=Arundo donax TaxID=35708 RepID=A0A0A8ZL95_ARUDO
MFISKEKYRMHLISALISYAACNTKVCVALMMPFYAFIT